MTPQAAFLIIMQAALPKGIDAETRAQRLEALATLAQSSGLPDPASAAKAAASALHAADQHESQAMDLLRSTFPNGI